MPELLPAIGRVAGIDYGTVRIGVAITDPGRKIASPLTNYTRRTEALDAAWFAALANHECITGFVVGLPVFASGEESPKSREVRAFGAWLARTSGRPVCFHDERYSSTLAEQLLVESGLTRKRRKERLDMLAAQMILTAWLDAEAAGNHNAEPHGLEE